MGTNNGGKSTGSGGGRGTRRRKPKDKAMNLLKLSDTDLSLKLGEILEVNGHHDFPLVGDYMDAKCDLCGCWDNEWPAEEPCKKAVKFDPIPLKDWNVAMKWRDWAVGECGISAFGVALHNVMDAEGLVTGVGWEFVATARHYLIAAAYLKMKGA